MESRFSPSDFMSDEIAQGEAMVKQTYARVRHKKTVTF